MFINYIGPINPNRNFLFCNFLKKDLLVCVETIVIARYNYKRVDDVRLDYIYFMYCILGRETDYFSFTQLSSQLVLNRSLKLIEQFLPLLSAT